MRNKLAAAATMAAMLALPSTAEAAKWTRVKGVTYFSDQVWSNQIDAGEPLAAFPRNCTNCDFTIFFEFLPKDPPSCQDDGSLPNFMGCSEFDRCVAWVEFGEHILPLRTNAMHGNQPEWPITIMLDFRENGPMMNTSNIFIDIRGKGYQMLQIFSWELEISVSKPICRMGIAAAYYPHSKDAYEDGRLLPR